MSTLTTHTHLIFFFTDTPTTEIYTLSLHDALPISGVRQRLARGRGGDDQLDGARSNPGPVLAGSVQPGRGGPGRARSEEHTSELQSHSDLVCRLLLEKKKKQKRQEKKKEKETSGTQ